MTSGRGSTGLGRRSALPAAAYGAPPPARAGVNALNVAFRGDDGRQANFDFATFPLPGWHAPLAEAFGSRVGAAGGLRTLTSAKNSWEVLGRLMRFLTTLPRPPATPQQLTVAHMEAFQRHRTTVHDKWARKDVQEIGVFLARTELALLMAPDVMDYVGRRYLRGDRAPGVGGYSDGEFSRLVAAARADVAVIRDRLGAGEELLASYRRDPTGLPAEQETSGLVLAQMATTGMVPPLPGPFGENLVRRVNLARRLFLTLSDLAPLMVLLAAMTGRNGETIKELPAEHRILNGRAVELEVIKRRRGDRRWFQTVTWEIGPPERALHTPGGMYLLLLSLTARSRGFCGGDQAICLWRNGYQAGVARGPDEHHAPFAEKLHGAQSNASSWAALRRVDGQARPILADMPAASVAPAGGAEVPDALPLRVTFNRIKTSVDVRRTKQMGGHLPSAARTNTMQVLFRSYLSGDATVIDWAQDIVGDAVVDAERAAVDAHQRAMALSGGPLRVVPGPVGEAELQRAGMAPDAARQAMAGELDTAWTACVDHDHHPATGQVCGQSFLDCFHCGNCLVTGDHLSGLLGLLDALTARRATMGEAQWWARYGPAWAAIRRDILAKFSPAELQRAAAAKPVDALLDLVEEPWEHP